MWTQLIYDKYSGNERGVGCHTHSNPLTINVSLEDLEDGTYEYLADKRAYDYYNGIFTGGFRLPDIVINDPLFGLCVYTKTENSILFIHTIVNVNHVGIEALLHDEDPIPHMGFLIDVCKYHLSYTKENYLSKNKFWLHNNSIDKTIENNTQFVIDKAMTPIDYTVDPKIHQIKKITLDLFDYQRCSIRWMIQKERHKKTIEYNVNDEVVMGNIYYDVFEKKFMLCSNRSSITFHGGGLIDEVGLGKTIMTIGLVLYHPPPVVKPQFPNRIYSRATLVLCPNQLCGQWLREIKNNVNKKAKIKIVQMLTKRDFDKVTYKEIIEADIIIMSYTFLDNKAYIKPTFENISNSQTYHRQKWHKSDFDYVGKKMDEHGTYLVQKDDDILETTCPLFHLIHWHRLVVDEFHEIYKGTSCEYINNLLYFFRSTYRWVVTATPFASDNCLMHIVDFLTEYTNNDGSRILTIDNVLGFLGDECFRRNTKESVKSEHSLPLIREEIQWLKFSPTERMMYNAYVANPNNDKYSVYLRQLCCHPKLAEETKEALSNCKTLKDIEKIMLSHYQIQVNESKLKVVRVEARIEKINYAIVQLTRRQKKQMLRQIGVRFETNDDDQMNDIDVNINLDADEAPMDLVSPDKEKELGPEIDDMFEEKIGEKKYKPNLTVQRLYQTLKETHDRLAAAQNILNGNMTTFNFFNNVIKRIRKTVQKVEDGIEISNDDTEEDDCGICLDKIQEANIGVTKCGHMFCYSCLESILKNSSLCPYCRKKLGPNDIFTLSYERKKKEVSKEDLEKEELINNVGTKLGNLILYLRESPEHTIIFSQWGDLLRRVGAVLNEHNVPNVFCKGNVFQRDKAIREFNEDDKIKVIMLSSESMASGTNLTKASRVIFIDPIYGDYKYRKAQERQAIGRAHRLGQKANIKIIRFIIRDSVEEEIYQQNLAEDQKHQDSEEDIEIDELEIS